MCAVCVCVCNVMLVLASAQVRDQLHVVTKHRFAVSVLTIIIAHAPHNAPQFVCTLNGLLIMITRLASTLTRLIVCATH